MNKFSLIIPNEAKKTFIDFQSNRKNTSSDNKHVLQLSQLIIYFEYFYFFYLTDDSQFILSEEDKTKLVESIKQCMQPPICETGIITRFEDILQSSRKDDNWIAFQLYQQRRNIIQEIADEYNTLNQILDVFSIHTVFHVTKFAQKEHFGINVEEEIVDIHASGCNIPKIRAYTKGALEKKRNQYCKNIEFTLTQHVVFETTKHLKKQQINIEDWEDNKIKLTDEQFATLNEFISNLFTKKDSRSLISFDEEGYAFLLKKKECAQSIQVLVHEQLVTNNLLVPFEFAQKNKSIRNDLFLGEKITFSQLLEFKTGINTLEQKQLSNFLASQQSIIIEYPKLLLDAIINLPLLLKAIPPQIRNNIELTDVLFKEIEALLIKAIENDHYEEKNKLIELISLFFKSNPLYIFELSTKILDNELCALQLVTKNKFIYRYLSEKLRKNSFIYEAAINDVQSVYFHPSFLSELFSDYYKLLKRLPEELSQKMRGINGEQKLFEQFSKVHSLVLLVESSSISARQLIHLNQETTPHELLLVIQERKNRGLAALPFCNESSLRVFAEIVEESLWNKGFLTIKRQLSKNRLNNSNEQIEQSIINTKSWIQAYFKAERIMNSPPFLAKKIIKNLSILFKIIAPLIIINLMKYAAYDVFIFKLLATIASFLVANIGLFSYILLHALILARLAKLTPTPYIYIVFACIILCGFIALTPTLQFIAFVELIYLSFCALFILTNLTRLITGQPLNEFNVSLSHVIITSLEFIYPICNYVITFSQLAKFNFKTFFEESKLFVLAISSLLMTKKTISISNIEDQVIYLQNAQEQSANEKGELLNELWEHIQNEVESEKNEITYKQAIYKKYPINTSSGLCEFSFSEVAAQPRKDANHFDMSPPKRSYSFFNIKQRTATEKIIDECMESTVTL